MQITLPLLVLLSMLCFNLGFVMPIARNEAARRRLFAFQFDDLMEDVRKGQPTYNSSSPSVNPSKWRKIDWTENGQDRNSLCLQPSPVDAITLRGNRLIFMKRDDLLRLPGSQISGNKVWACFGDCPLVPTSCRLTNFANEFTVAKGS